jgi:hypothetical protein
MERQTYIPVEGLGLTEELNEQLIKTRTHIEKGKEWEHYTPEFVAVNSAKVDVGVMLAQATLIRENYQESKLSQKDAVVKFGGDLPVAVVGMGDLHLGSYFCNIDEVVRKFRVIAETPNMYMVLMANLIDNAIPSQFPSNMLVNNLTPDKQVIVMRKMVEDMNARGKILAAVTSPCHEGWTWKHTGQDINALLFGFDGRKFPVLQNGGQLTIKFPQQEYTGFLFHQVGPFESNFNETHALKQMNRLRKSMKADFMFGGHRHTADTETPWEGSGQDRKIVAYLRTGSEKGTDSLHDEWAVGRYGDTGEPTGVMLHLTGDHRGIMTNTDFNMGVLCHQNMYVGEIVKREGVK